MLTALPLAVVSQFLFISHSYEYFVWFKANDLQRVTKKYIFAETDVEKGKKELVLEDILS